jgi:hypothetical protein
MLSTRVQLPFSPLVARWFEERFGHADGGAGGRLAGDRRGAPIP